MSSLRKPDLVDYENHPRWDALLSRDVVDESTSSYEWTEYYDPSRGTGAVPSSGEVRFRIPITSSYIDLRESYISCDLTFSRQNGTAGNIVRGACFPKLNAFGIFKRLQLYLGGQCIEEIQECDIVAFVNSMLVNYDNNRQQNRMFLQFKDERGAQTGGIINKTRIDTYDNTAAVNNRAGGGFNRRYVEFINEYNIDDGGNIAANTTDTYVINVILPLRLLFKSLESMSALAGLSIEVRAQMGFDTLNNNFANVVVAAPNWTLTVSDMKYVVYSCKPRGETEVQLLEFFNKKEPKLFMFDAISTYTATSANSIDITSLKSRPKYCILYQYLTAQDGVTSKLPLDGGITDAELRYNNIVVPSVRYNELNTSRGKQRMYYELLRMFGNTEEESFPVSFKDFELNYFVFAFDLSEMDPAIFRAGDARLSFKCSNANVNNTMVAILWSERSLMVQGLGGSQEALQVVTIDGK